jgi:hypothetical protein
MMKRGKVKATEMKVMDQLMFVLKLKKPIRHRFARRLSTTCLRGYIEIIKALSDATWRKANFLDTWRTTRLGS